jgi:hypothetical protein
MAMTLDGSNGVTFNDASLQGAAASPFGLKNRIINGDMVIDQRNAGGSVSLGAGVTAYSADRFRIENNTTGTATAQQVSDAPTGFSNSLKYTVTATDASLASTENAFIQQNIEGFNTADLSFGTASAKTITISFWVKSSLTGTFGGSIINNSYSRLYPYSYTISAANTWEYKTVTISGDTTGTWIGATNSIGLRLMVCLAAASDRVATAGAWTTSLGFGPTGQTNLMATNGATFQITGVQLEQNTSATPFERRLYNQELANCQRYFAKMGTAGTLYSAFGSCAWTASTSASGFIKYPTTMRSSPTLAYGGVIGFSYAGGSVSNVTGVGSTYAGTDSILWQPSGLTSATNGQAGIILANNDSTAFISFSAEL